MVKKNNFYTSSGEKFLFVHFYDSSTFTVVVLVKEDFKKLSVDYIRCKTAKNLNKMNSSCTMASDKDARAGTNLSSGSGGSGCDNGDGKNRSGVDSQTCQSSKAARPGPAAPLPI